MGCRPAADKLFFCGKEWSQGHRPLLLLQQHREKWEEHSVFGCVVTVLVKEHNWPNEACAHSRSNQSFRPHAYGMTAGQTEIIYPPGGQWLKLNEVPPAFYRMNGEVKELPIERWAILPLKGWERYMSDSLSHTHLQIPLACFLLRSGSKSPRHGSGSAPAWPMEYGKSDADQFLVQKGSYWQPPYHLECPLLGSNHSVTSKFVGKPTLRGNKIWGSQHHVSSQLTAGPNCHPADELSCGPALQSPDSLHHWCRKERPCFPLHPVGATSL